jgi:hypothetical protein
MRDIKRMRLEGQGQWSGAADSRMPLGVLHIEFTIVEARYQGRGKMAQSKHIFPFIGHTIRTHISDAFVAVTGTCHSHTGDIKQNGTDRTFLWHVFLVGPER